MSAYTDLLKQLNAQYAQLSGTGGVTNNLAAAPDWVQQQTTVGTTPNAYEPAYGGVPSAPSTTMTQAGAIGATTANLPALQTLASGTNVFNQSQLLGQYQSALPQYNALTTSASANIADALAGQVPADVINLMQQQAAERGIATGSAGSPNMNAAYLRALGLTSLARKDVGQAQLTEAIRRTPIAPLFNPATFYVTPEQQYNAQLLGNIYAASPQPGPAARAGLRVARSALSAGMGSAGGYSPYSPGMYGTSPAQQWAASNAAAEAQQLAARQAAYNAYWASQTAPGAASSTPPLGTYTAVPGTGYDSSYYPSTIGDYGAGYGDYYSYYG